MSFAAFVVPRFIGAAEIPHKCGHYEPNGIPTRLLPRQLSRTMGEWSELRIRPDTACLVCGAAVPADVVLVSRPCHRARQRLSSAVLSPSVGGFGGVGDPRRTICAIVLA